MTDIWCHTRRRNIDIEHTLHAANLPLHHRDPFDLMLIAQSLMKNWLTVTLDMVFDQYGVKRIWWAHFVQPSPSRKRRPSRTRSRTAGVRS
jgi:hypothetical protein